MTKLKAPKFLDVIAAVGEAGAVRVNDIVEATGCDYGPSRRVLDLLADEGLIVKAMRGERTFEYQPVEATAIGHEELAQDISERVEGLGLGDRESDYPPEWIAAADSVEQDDGTHLVDLIPAQFPIEEWKRQTAICPTEDSETFRIVRIENGYPVTLGEISEVDLKDRVRYQVTSPWEAKSYRTLSEAVAALDGNDDRV